MYVWKGSKREKKHNILYFVRKYSLWFFTTPTVHIGIDSALTPRWAIGGLSIKTGQTLSKFGHRDPNKAKLQKEPCRAWPAVTQYLSLFTPSLQGHCWVSERPVSSSWAFSRLDQGPGKEMTWPLFFYSRRQQWEERRGERLNRRRKLTVLRASGSLLGSFT